MITALLIVLGFVALLVLIAAFQPSQFRISRRAVIAAPAATDNESIREPVRHLRPAERDGPVHADDSIGVLNQLVIGRALEIGLAVLIGAHVARRVPQP